MTIKRQMQAAFRRDRANGIRREPLCFKGKRHDGYGISVAHSVRKLIAGRNTLERPNHTFKPQSMSQAQFDRGGRSGNFGAVAQYKPLQVGANPWDETGTREIKCQSAEQNEQQTRAKGMSNTRIQPRQDAAGQFDEAEYWDSVLTALDNEEVANNRQQEQILGACSANAGSTWGAARDLWLYSKGSKIVSEYDIWIEGLKEQANRMEPEAPKANRPRGHFELTGKPYALEHGTDSLAAMYRAFHVFGTQVQARTALFSEGIQLTHQQTSRLTAKLVNSGLVRKVA